MDFATFFGLILCNIVWAANPVMAKILMRDFSAEHTAWLRTAGALLGIFALMPFLGRRGVFLIPQGRSAPRWKESLWILGLGFFSFCFAPFLMMAGLQDTQAVDNSLIVAMEPLITVIMASLFLREPIRAYHIASFLLSFGGFCLLARISPMSFIDGLDSHSRGNLIILLSLAGEGLYSVFGRKLTRGNSPVPVFGSAVLAGALLLSLAVAPRFGLPDLHILSLKTALAWFWLGPIGTAGTYLFWMIVLTRAHIPTMALTLFVQPIAGAALGYFGLGERLGPAQWIGALLILLAVAIPAVRERTA